MPLPKEQAWFECKRYGNYRWGKLYWMPCRWEGWVVFFGGIAAVLAGIPLTHWGDGYFLAYIAGIAILVYGIGRWKGEPLRW